MAGKLISDLNSVGTLGLADQMEIDKDVSGVRTSYKTSVKDIVDFANQNVAEEYDSTSSYAVGDYCIYESVLYKCTASTTGSFDNTKWTSVVVTDEMGSGGGGTGGHTIIDESGTSMTARAGLQFVGGANVSDDAINNKTIVDLASAGGIDGVFIDTENVIQASTSISTSSDTTYTATEDCALRYEIYSTSSLDGYLKVDNNWIIETAGSVYVANVIYVKKGQTVTMRSQGSAGSYTVYGIQTGITHSKFQPVIYSTEEREVGVWKDGKPLYQKTLVVANVGSVGSSITTPIQINDVPFDYIDVVDANIYDSNDNRRYNVPNLPKDTADRIFMHPYLNKSSNPVVFYLSLYSGGTTYSNMTDFNVTIQYTKSTDVAGSGSWTPQGVPTHHYSTDEHIIGTWIDGSTLYEKTWDLGSDIAVTSWTTTIMNLTGIRIIKSESVQNDNAVSFIEYWIDGTTLKGKTLRDNDATDYVRYLTLQYIKLS